MIKEGITPEKSQEKNKKEVSGNINTALFQMKCFFIQ